MIQNRIQCSENMEERFSFVTDNQVQNVREDRVPANTKKHTKWSTNVYSTWKKAREEAFKDFQPENMKFGEIPTLEKITTDEINYWLSNFAIEAKKADGSSYRHEVLYSLFCGINRTIQETLPTVNLFRTPDLKPFQQVLDGKLKELQASQVPFRKRADAVSLSDEEKLWDEGVLGTHSPDSVINTLLFLSGKLFALRGGQEQRSLTHDQFQFIDMADGKVMVKYAEKVSKVNQGGLKRRKVETKRVEHIEDPMNDRSFTFIYNFYKSKSPDGVEELFYLKPCKNWTYSKEIWFEKRPIGKKTIDQRVKTMCKQAGIEGNFSNHSLRATAVTRIMYDAGVPEKQIMKRSGHKSLEGVRTYQREESSETHQVSKVLASPKEVTTSSTISSKEKNDDDELISQCLDEFEQKSNSQSFHLSGLLSNSNVNNVSINITINKA